MNKHEFLAAFRAIGIGAWGIFCIALVCIAVGTFFIGAVMGLLSYF